MLRSTALLCCGAALLICTASAAIAAESAARATKPAIGEADYATLLGTLRANRRAFVAANLNLPKDQAAQFWPLYDKYQAEIGAIGDRALALVREYVDHFADLSDDKALQVVTDYLNAEAARLKVRQDYLPQFAKIVPGRTVARFYQIENKIDAMLRNELAATIPVIEQAPGAAK
jgi:hypothetical protein